MATKRKPIPKKIRFEVFKRDKFTCQYCGRMAPDVVLEIDHIKPVSKGGTNDIMNLITSCRDCNRGKTNKELSDDSTIKKQQAQLKELADRNEQLEMMLEWRKGLDELTEKQVSAVTDEIYIVSGYKVVGEGRKLIARWVKEFGLEAVLEAVDISFDQYDDGTRAGCNYAFDKISGICYNRARGDANQAYYYNYLRKAMLQKYDCIHKEKLRFIVDKFIRDNEDFELAKKRMYSNRNFWSWYYSFPVG